MIRLNNKEAVSWSPGLTPRKLLEQHGLAKGNFAFVVDGQIVPSSAYDSFEIPDEAKVNMFPLAHGG